MATKKNNAKHLSLSFTISSTAYQTNSMTTLVVYPNHNILYLCNVTLFRQLKTLKKFNNATPKTPALKKSYSLQLQGHSSTHHPYKTMNQGKVN